MRQRRDIRHAPRTTHHRSVTYAPRVEFGLDLLLDLRDLDPDRPTEVRQFERGPQLAGRLALAAARRPPPIGHTRASRSRSAIGFPTREVGADVVVPRVGAHAAREDLTVR